MPAASRQMLESYSGLDRSEAEVTRPDSTTALLDSFAKVAQNRQSMVLRGAGGSFHDQSLHQGPVLMLDQMPRFLEVHDGIMVAASGVSYGEANRAALEQGFVLPIAPTSERITLGGGLVSNCVSRFSPLAGKSADAVESFELLTPDGRRRIVWRPGQETSAENDALFRAVPGGLGYLGFVGSLRTRLWPLGVTTPGVEPRIETTATPATGFDPQVDALVRDHLTANPQPRIRPTVPGTGSWVLTNQRGQGMVFHSHYVSAEQPLKPFFLHRPRGFIHQLGQFASVFRLWTQIGWRLGWSYMTRRKAPYVDDFAGFTFMMDGNWRARERLRRLRIPAWLLQQSYLLPIQRGAADPGTAAKTFLDRARRALHDARIEVDVIDMLTLPADEYLLSASRDCEGVLISLSCQGLTRRQADRFSKVLRALSRDCCELNGRVQLTRNVFVDPDVMQTMYGPALQEFLQLKRQVDPNDVLRNPFLERLLSGA